MGIAASSDVEHHSATSGDEFGPKLSTAKNYLEWLDPDAEEFDFRLIDPKGKQPPKKLRGSLDDEGIAEKLIEVNRAGAGVFVTVNETDGKGVKVENIVRVRAVWADWDEGKPDNLPLQPSICVTTSPGKYQAYWVLDDEMTKAQFASVMDTMVKDYRADAGAKDIARVLRVPGFYHTKGEPFRCKLLKGSGQCYTADELMEAFPPISKKAKSGVAHSALGQLGGDKFEPDLVRAALSFVPADDYSTYWTVIATIKRGSNLSDEGKEIAREWAEQSAKFDDDEFERRWSRGKEGDGEGTIQLGTLFKLAQDHGFVFPVRNKAPLVEVVQDGVSAVEWGVNVGEWNDEGRNELLARMNREHAVVSIGGSVRYLHRAYDHKGNEELRFLRAEDMKALYSAVLVNKNTTAFDLWRQWTKRKYHTGIGMFPGQMRVPAGYLNLWVGFAVDPCEGDWSLFRKHLRERVCGGDDTLFDWLMDWLAHLVQRPEEKAGSAIVLQRHRSQECR